MRPAGTHGRPGIELGQRTQLGTGLAAALHAMAFIAAGLGTQQTATAVKMVPAQRGRGLQPIRSLPVALAIQGGVVQPRIAVIQRGSHALAVDQSIPVAVVGGFAHLLQPQHPVQLARGKSRLAIQIQPRAQHAAVIALLTLHPGAAARAREPAHKILLRGIDKAQQPGLATKRVLGVKAQRAEVLVGTVSHHARIFTLWVLPPLRFGQIAGRIATRLMPAAGQRNIEFFMHLVLPGAAEGAALKARAGPRTIAARMLGRQIELIAALQPAPQRGLRIPQAVRACADLHIGIAAAAARAQLHQTGAVVIALQHRYRAAIDIDLVQLQRHHHIQIEVAIGM